MDKLNLYRILFADYCKSRFGLRTYLPFAILLTVIGFTGELDWKVNFFSFAFIFASLFVYRWIDDAGSFYMDRIDHPERTYLHPPHFKIFLLIGAVITIIYYSSLYAYNAKIGNYLLAFYILSILLYVLFLKSKMIFIVPLLKYPMLIWIINGFSMKQEVLFLGLTSLVMMIVYDLYNHPYFNIKKNLYLKLIMLLSCGILVTQPWAEESAMYLDFILLITPLIMLVHSFFKNKPSMLILILGIVHVIDIII